MVRTLEDLLLEPLSGPVLEFGCGTGGVTRALAELPNVSTVYANDISPDVAHFFHNQPNLHKKISFVGDDLIADQMKLAQLSYDFAITTNTLEHIPQDGEALRAITRHARKGYTLVLVPALECLFGTCDGDGGHIRRYSRESFAAMCTASELRVDRIHYVNLVGALAWWAQYVLLQRRDYASEEHARPYSFFDKRILPLTAKIEKRTGVPFGLSLVAKVSLP